MAKSNPNLKYVLSGMRTLEESSYNGNSTQMPFIKGNTRQMPFKKGNTSQMPFKKGNTTSMPFFEN